MLKYFRIWSQIRGDIRECNKLRGVIVTPKFNRRFENIREFEAIFEKTSACQWGAQMG